MVSTTLVLPAVIAAYAVVLENAAFFSDLALRYPDVVLPLYTENKKSAVFVQRAFNFVSATDILSEIDRKGFHLVSGPPCKWCIVSEKFIYKEICVWIKFKI